jgi:hypothetical protein
MNYNLNKYYIEDSGLLTEAEKLRLAKDLVELERRGILEYRDGRWGFAAGIEIEKTAEGAPVARSRNKEEGGN